MSESVVSVGRAQSDPAVWKQIVAKYQRPSNWRGGWQIFNTLVPFVALWCAMYFLQKVSIWLALPLAILTGGFMVRLFILFHDCGHHSFFKSPAANDLVGSFMGILCFTPYFQWRWEHSIHHGTAGDLDRRGTGDVWTLTVQEYLEASRWKRFAYRLARNPIVLFVFAPLFVFLIQQRFVNRKAPKRERVSVYWTNLGILVMVAGSIWLFGVRNYLVLMLPAVMIAGAAGLWLFYVQHQFDGVYWERREEWDYTKAALEGSSFYKLPRVLQWFSGNIGFHHIHHLSSRIPNYNLEKCHRSEQLFQSVKPLTLSASFKSLAFRLWDEQRQKLIGFGALKAIRIEQGARRRQNR